MIILFLACQYVLSSVMVLTAHGVLHSLESKPWSEKSSGLLKAVSTILFHCRGVPSCGEWRRQTAHRRGFLFWHTRADGEREHAILTGLLIVGRPTAPSVLRQSSQSTME